VQLGYVDSASVEFKPLAWEPRPGGGRRYKHALLLAWSFVNLPANREARVERSTDYAWARKWLSTEPAVPSRGRTWSPASIAQEACVEVKRGWEQIDWTQAAESRSGPLSDPRDQARRQLQQAVVIAKSAGALANERERRCDHVDVFASYGLQVRRREAGLCWKCGRPDPKGVVLELEDTPTMLELDEEVFEVDAEQVTKATRAAWDRGVHAAVAQAVQQAIDYARGRVH
ncbi:MAG: hypothetical protein ACREB3_13585, partial [Burkholderiales bacterium]